MAIQSVYPLEVDPPIVRGDPLSIQFNFTKQGQEVDITDWTWRAHVRRSADAAFIMEFYKTVTTPAQGTLPSQLVLSLTSEQTAQLRAGMVFDVEQLTPTHLTWFICTRLRVVKDVSHEPGPPVPVVPPPAPVISALTPGTVVVSDPAIEVTVSGSNLTATSVVEIDQAPQATTYVDGTNELTVTYDASVVGTVMFTVRNDDDQLSDPFPFVVADDPPPAPPVIEALSPDTVAASDPPTLVTVTGSDLQATSVVEIDQVPQTTTFDVNTNDLSVLYDAAVAGTVMFVVRNDDDQVSNSFPFIVTDA